MEIYYISEIISKKCFVQSEKNVFWQGLFIISLRFVYFQFIL